MINITREQFFNFIKSENDKDGVVSKNTQHYLDYFDKYQATGDPTICTNYAALLFGPLWFFYRKMYLYGVIFFVADVGLSQICQYIYKILYGRLDNGLFEGGRLELIIGVLFMRIIFYYANYVYFHYACKQIEKRQEYKGVDPAGVHGILFFIIVLGTIALLSYMIILSI